jgi:putative ABC transport system permease protein
VELAIKNLLHDRYRFLVTVGGIGFAVLLVLVQCGLFLGILDNASVTIENLPAQLWVTSRGAANVDFAHTFPEGLVDRVRSTPGVELADNLLVTIVDLTLPDGSQEMAVVYGLEDFERWQYPWHVLSGNPAELRRSPSVLVDASARSRFGNVKPGQYLEILGNRVKVLGLTDGARSFTTTPILFANYERIQRWMPEKFSGMTTYIVATVSPHADIATVRKEIARRLPYHDVHTREEWSSRSRGYWIKNTGLGYDMALTVLLGCLVGVMIVSQTLYASTMENLKQFAVVKAIGGTNGDVCTIIGSQALLASQMGFLLGGLGTLLFVPIVSYFDLKLIAPRELISAVYAGTVTLCLAAGLLSFSKVANLDPAIAFRE